MRDFARRGVIASRQPQPVEIENADGFISFFRFASKLSRRREIFLEHFRRFVLTLNTNRKENIHE
jgi:hypothetical protein